MVTHLLSFRFFIFFVWYHHLELSLLQKGTGGHTLALSHSQIPCHLALSSHLLQNLPIKTHPHHQFFLPTTIPPSDLIPPHHPPLLLQLFIIKKWVTPPLSTRRHPSRYPENILSKVVFMGAMGPVSDAEEALASMVEEVDLMPQLASETTGLEEVPCLACSWGDWTSYHRTTPLQCHPPSPISPPPCRRHFLPPSRRGSRTSHSRLPASSSSNLRAWRPELDPGAVAPITAAPTTAVAATLTTKIGTVLSVAQRAVVPWAAQRAVTKSQLRIPTSLVR